VGFKVIINKRIIGENNPIYVIAEIGINHNGSLDDAINLMKVAKKAKCDAVKFQKRNPEVCVPEEQKYIMRETPWGTMTYLDYRYRVEFGLEEYKKIDQIAKELEIDWFASPWDVSSVVFLREMKVPVIKIASACLTDDGILDAVKESNIPAILSTGMSTIAEIDHAVSRLDKTKLVLMAATSSYPMNPIEANLRTIKTLIDRYQVPVGYSGHEVGLQISIAAAALGACVIERHITLDRAMWGSDQAASLEPQGIEHLVRDIRIVESALGDGVKKVWESELEPMKKLRRKTNK
jgi:N-acetylneuraminate synthase